MPSQRSSSPVADSTNFDDDDLEYQRWMRGSTPASEPQLGDNNADVANVDNIPSTPGTAVASSVTGEGSGNFLEGSVASRNELATMQHIADQMKLTLYQKTEAEEFCKFGAINQRTKLFLHLCRLESKFDALIAAVPPFVVGPALHVNVKTFIMAVLLSSKLNAYKGEVPRKHVWVLLMKERLHLPPNFNRDPYAVATLKAELTEELIQARSKLKKTINANKEDNIYDLETEMVSGTQCPVTVPLCARVALLHLHQHKVFSQVTSKSFWDAVDKHLKQICKVAKDDPVLITRAFAGLLKADQGKFSGDMSDFDQSETTSAGDIWQQDIDELVQG